MLTKAPYCSVKFAYTNRNHDVNLNYIAGSEFEETKLLSEIGIYYGAELYRRYTMTYNYDGNDFYLSFVKKLQLPVRIMKL